ncbi:MAG: competence protein CoiA family protein [Bacteroidales bacterium]|jgi:hypothetical protein
MHKIKYRYAITQNMEVVEISSLTKESKIDTTFSCLGCGERLIPRIGTKKQKHFAHFNANSQCSYESYLHKTAKTVLFNNIKRRLENKLPLYIEYMRNKICNKCERIDINGCKLSEYKEKKNILLRYNEVYLEKEFNMFKPDVLLKSKNDHLFFEIYVTHETEEKKRKSENKIIEILIENEDDIKMLVSDTIFINDKSINSNIEIEPLYIDYSKYGMCISPINKFIIYKSGKVVYFTETIGKYQKVRKSIVYEKDYDNNSFEKANFILDIIEAYEKGVKVNNCHLCRYHGINRDYLESKLLIFCKYKREAVNSNNAAECDIYKIDKKSFTKID